MLDLLPGPAGTVSADVLFLLTSPGSTGNVQGEVSPTLHQGCRRGGFWRLCAFLLKQVFIELSLELLQNKLYHHRAGSCGSCKHSVAILLYQLVHPAPELAPCFPCRSVMLLLSTGTKATNVVEHTLLLIKLDYNIPERASVHCV